MAECVCEEEGSLKDQIHHFMFLATGKCNQFRFICGFEMFSKFDINCVIS